LPLPLPFGKVRGGLGDPMENSGAKVNAITPREREVLLELCRPAATRELFVEPASVREIAHALAVTEAAVKQHLLNLYDKFGIGNGHERRRVALARQAMRSGVIGLPDLPTGPTEENGAS
jgi:DNA-binding NarL/FixJ family response regulator